MNSRSDATHPKRQCPECGARIDADYPQGLCARCLLRLARHAFDSSALPPPHPLGLGEFADYELLSEIGHGGMGVVYQARQSSLDRIVALKMLLGGQFAEPQARARFRSEAEITAQLQHPNIVAIHEVGEHDHLPFFTMDYVEGRSLAEVARDKPLTPVATAGYLSIIARAIAYAHERGVLHRDLKPSNILIDGSDQPRITDFGLAKRLTGSTTSLTLSGEALGSPNFMPPEQAAGRHKEIGPASDVYGLGAVLYYLITSRPPFIADNLTAAVRQVQDQEPVAPRMLNPGVPRDLETICLKCLQKEPSRRYQTAAELADELDRFRRSEPIRARPVGPAGRVWRWCRRRPALAAALAGVFVLAVVSTTVAVRMTIEREGRERERYRANIQLAAARIEEGSIDVALETLLDCPERFRHWEWGYLVAQCHREVMTLEEARTDPVATYVDSYRRYQDWRCGFSADGKRLGVLHPRGVAQVWEWPTGKPLWSLREQVDPGVRTIWMADWRGVVLGRSNVVEVVRPGNPDSRLQFQGHDLPVRALGLTQDGRRVAAVAADDTVRIWDVTNSEELACFPVVPAAKELFFSAAGDRLVVVADSEAASYDSRNGQVISRSPAQEPSIMTMLPDPEAERFVSVNVMEGSQDLWGASLWTTNGLVKKLSPMKDPFGRVEFSPDRTALCLCGSGSATPVLDSLTGEPLCVIPERVVSAAFSPDRRRIATHGVTPTVRVWDVSNGRELLRLKGHQKVVNDLAFSPDGRLLAAVSDDGTVKVWSALPGREHLPQYGRPWGFSETSDGRRIATAPRPERITIWNPASGQQLADLRRHHHYTIAVAFHPDDRLLAAGDTFGGIAVWDVESGRLLRTLRGHEFLIWGGLSYSPNGRYLASAGHDGTVRIWSADALEPLRVFQHRSPFIESIDFISDSRHLAATDGDIIRIWNVDTGRCESQLRGHSQTVLAVRFSPDGRRLATSSLDGTLRIWDVRSGEPRSVWRLRGSYARGISFSPDGRRVALRMFETDIAASDALTVEIWNVDTGQQLLADRGFVENGVFARFTRDGRRLITDDRNDNELRQRESFPWATAEYPGPRHQPLRERMRLYAHRYWQDRLEAERQVTATNATLVVDVPFDRSRIPPRDPAAPLQAIDLADHYTSRLDECSIVTGTIAYMAIDWRNAPGGLITIHGIPFDLRGIVQLGRDRSKDPSWGHQPESVRQIPVRQHGQRLHAVLGCFGTVAEGRAIGSFALHYADGGKHELEIQYGRHVRHMFTEWLAYVDPRTDTQFAQVAWEGPHAAPHIHPTRLRIYHATWDNPRPDQEIVSFDFISKMTITAAPFLMAVTLE